ncbi:hypothetical protein M6B38_264070 [Iris pallida]|uniref:Uncharacterized protein n=1 Tax=Iris pallida TaxID=29817 RepID=A0AAX6ICM3_IRIPA|nr:hypothetical protein M6B38_264070 [Iris pallida]
MNQTAFGYVGLCPTLWIESPNFGLDFFQVESTVFMSLSCV